MRRVLALALITIACQLTLSGTAWAAPRNVAIPVAPAPDAHGIDACHFSVAYSSGSNVTTYGPVMGCQWGRTAAFVLDWSLTPGHVRDESTHSSFGIAGSLGMGLKVNLVSTTVGSRALFGWSLHGKGLAGTGFFEDHGWGFSYGGSLGTMLDFTHPVAWGYSLSWGPFFEWVPMAGDLDGQAAHRDFGLGLLDVGISLAVEPAEKPSSLVATVGALLDAADGANPMSWVSLGVRF